MDLVQPKTMLITVYMVHGIEAPMALPLVFSISTLNVVVLDYS